MIKMQAQIDEPAEASSAVRNDMSALEEKARWVWRETLAIYRNAKELRIASSLSAVEIFVVLFYGKVLRQDPKHPLTLERDRFVVSKGHGSVSMYPILADLGFFAHEELDRVCRKGGILGAIPDPIVPGYETVNGSLGHGLGVATGMALGCLRQKRSNGVFVLCGDGELHEGANWEAAMFASHHALDNLHLIVDDNEIAMLGRTAATVSHGDLGARLAAFGWDVRTADGHDIGQLYTTLSTMKALRQGKPKALIAKTLKGRGIPGLENAPLSHIMAVSPELIEELLSKAFR